MKFLTLKTMALALILAIIIPQLFVFEHNWIYDDKALAQDNVYIRDNNIKALLSTPYWAGVPKITQQENLYRPFFLLTFCLFKNSPRSLNFFIQILHLCVGLFLFLHLRKLLQSSNIYSANFNSSIALCGAAFFLVHPALVEVTAQGVGLMELMPTLLGLMALYFFRTHATLALFLVGLAPGWKETGFIYLGALVFLFALTKKYLNFVIGLFIIGTWFMIRYQVYGSLFEFSTTPFYLLNPLVNMTAGDAFWSRLTLLGYYLKLYLIPNPLSSDYSLGTLGLPGYPLQLWVLLSCGFLIFIFKKLKEEKLTFFQLPQLTPWIFILSLLPVIHLITPLAMIFAERFSYGFYVGLTLLLFSQIHFSLNNKTRNIFLGVLLVFYGLSLTRHSEWQSGEQLFKSDLTHYPINAKLHFNLGMNFGGQARWQEARAEFEKALQLVPEFPEAQFRYKVVLEKLAAEEQERSQK